MAIFTTFRMTAEDDAVLPALLKLGVIETSKSAMESPIFHFLRGENSTNGCSPPLRFTTASFI
jgi:hypothetical protein